jgi:serine protease Do
MTSRKSLAVFVLVLLLALGAGAPARAADARPWLGVALSGGQGEVQSTGVLIKGVAEGSPAEAAGIKSGDTLLAIDGEAAASAAEAAKQIGAMAPGTVVKLRILHEGSMNDIEVTLGTHPAEP